MSSVDLSPTRDERAIAMRGIASGSAEPVPDRQDPAKQVNARLLAPAVVLALARDRAAALLGVPDESGTDPERADENKGALAHTTRVVLRQRGVDGARGRGCSCSSQAALCAEITAGACRTATSDFYETPDNLEKIASQSDDRAG